MGVSASQCACEHDTTDDTSEPYSSKMASADVVYASTMAGLPAQPSTERGSSSSSSSEQGGGGGGAEQRGASPLAAGTLARTEGPPTQPGQRSSSSSSSSSDEKSGTAGAEPLQEGVLASTEPLQPARAASSSSSSSSEKSGAAPVQPVAGESAGAAVMATAVPTAAAAERADKERKAKKAAKAAPATAADIKTHQASAAEAAPDTTPYLAAAAPRAAAAAATTPPAKPEISEPVHPEISPKEAPIVAGAAAVGAVAVEETAPPAPPAAHAPQPPLPRPVLPPTVVAASEESKWTSEEAQRAAQGSKRAGGVEASGDEQRRAVQKRDRILKTFTKVMCGKGLEVRKHNRHKKGTAQRVIKYSPQDGGTIFWDSHKLLGQGNNDVPIPLITETSLEGKTVWIDSKDRGRVGFETKKLEDAHVLLLAVDYLREGAAAPQA